MIATKLYHHISNILLPISASTTLYSLEDIRPFGIMIKSERSDILISYSPFWKKLKESNLNSYRLIRYHNISPAQLTRIRSNMYISTRTVERLCMILKCQPGDIMEIILPIEQEEKYKDLLSDLQKIEF